MKYTKEQLLGRYYERKGDYYQIRDVEEDPSSKYMSAWLIGNVDYPHQDPHPRNVCNIMTPEDFYPGNSANRRLLVWNPFEPGEGELYETAKTETHEPDYDIY